MTLTTDHSPTVVRFHRAPAPIRAAFRVLERAAPAIGARWAERIWFTLPRPRPPTWRHRVQPVPGTPFTVDVAGRTVAGEAWGDGRPVYLAHGWAGHRGQFAAFVAPLVALGYRVVAFDAPSHGGSGPGRHGPRSSSVPEFATALAAVVAEYGPARAVVAHSMGATATAAALAGGLPADRVVMLAPMASPASYLHRFARLLGAGERIHRRVVVRVERRLGVPLHRFDVPELGRAIAMPPTLVIHDRDDASIPVADGVAIAANWYPSQLLVTEGLGHRRLLGDPDVVSRVIDFVHD
jgi:pimeloyl-ACP methyl ester carboxylesterase